MRLYPILKNTRLMLHVLRAQAQLSASRRRVLDDTELTSRTRTAIGLGASKRCACTRRRRARASTRRAALTCDTARLPAALMEFLKGPIPTFLTTPRSLL